MGSASVGWCLTAGRPGRVGYSLLPRQVTVSFPSPLTICDGRVEGVRCEQEMWTRIRSRGVAVTANMQRARAEGVGVGSTPLYTRAHIS